MHIFFSAGEPSGDQHAAHLLQALQQRVPNARFSGFGGVHLEQAGAEVLYPLTDMAVIGITAVLPLLRKFYNVAQMGRRFLEEQRPDAVVLVDFPGFNWHIAKYAKQLGIPVYYYCPPQLWAWGGWRIKKVRKYVDCILSVLPFEAEWYRKQGVRVEYVGHPFFDEIAEKPLDEAFCRELRASSPQLVPVRAPREWSFCAANAASVRLVGSSLPRCPPSHGSGRFSVVHSSPAVINVVPRGASAGDGGDEATGDLFRWHLEPARRPASYQRVVYR